MNIMLEQTIDWSYFAGAMPEILLAVYIMLLLMVGVYTQAKKSFHYVHNFSLLGILWIFIIILISSPSDAFAGQFVANHFTQYMKLLILLAGGMALLLAKKFVKAHDIHNFEYPVLVLSAILGMMLMVSADDFIILYMGLELQSLALYVLAAFQRDNVKSSEAGLKYFVLGAVASGLFLFGISYIYGFTGSTDFNVIREINSSQIGLSIGLVLVICALGFKISAAPFHMWTPDVYEGAPTSVTAFFAVAPKVAAVAVFMQLLLDPLLHLLRDWQDIVVLLSIFSMVVGAYGAIIQRNIKRLMAYSAIGHMGYALMGLASANHEGVQAIIIYMTIYLFMNVGVFAAIMMMQSRGNMVEGIDDLKGLVKYQPKMALAIMLLMFSMAGIPPLAGFFGKLYVFIAAVNADLVYLAVIGALASVISAFYYLRIIKIMYFDAPDQELDAPQDKSLQFLLYGNAVMVLILLLLMPVITRYAHFISNYVI